MRRAPMLYLFLLVCGCVPGASAQAPPTPARVIAEQQWLATVLVASARFTTGGATRAQTSLAGWDGCAARLVRRELRERPAELSIARFEVDLGRLDPDRCTAGDGVVRCPDRDATELGARSSRAAGARLSSPLSAPIAAWDAAIGAVPQREEPIGAVLELGPAIAGTDEAHLLRSMRAAISGCGGGRTTR